MKEMDQRIDTSTEDLRIKQGVEKIAKKVNSKFHVLYCYRIGRRERQLQNYYVRKDQSEDACFPTQKSKLCLNNKSVYEEKPIKIFNTRGRIIWGWK